MEFPTEHQYFYDILYVVENCEKIKKQEKRLTEKKHVLNSNST